VKKAVENPIFYNNSLNYIDPIMPQSRLKESEPELVYERKRQ
jgi:hypothetical protein